MAIDFKNKEYVENVEKWEMIERVCDGDGVDQYLLTLNPDDTSNENKLRNKAYKKRAVFYNVTGYTAEGLNSLLFSKQPVLEVPAQLEYVADNVDGAGVSIYQQAQYVASEVIKKSRCGLFVSYPITEGATSVADMTSGKVFATIHAIDADQIINCGVTLVGSHVKLALVVIKEVETETQEDGYKTEDVDQIRELALDDGVFTVRKWRKNKKDEWFIFSEEVPTDGAGKLWEEIPFTFVGSENNSHRVNRPKMYDMASINIGHYRNSADYEDSVWYTGQAQPWMSGVTQSHVDLMTENKMYVGSRQLFGVPAGETFGFASAPPNPLVRQAMIDKLEMMLGLGARFATPNGVAKTATQSSNEAQQQHSTLSMISSNVSEAYTLALLWCMRYMRVDGEATFKTTQDFLSPTATAQEIMAMVAGYLQGAMPVGDYFRWLKKVDLIDQEKTIEQFSEEVSTTPMPNLDENA